MLNFCCRLNKKKMVSETENIYRKLWKETTKNSQIHPTEELISNISKLWLETKSSNKGP